MFTVSLDIWQVSSLGPEWDWGGGGRKKIIIFGPALGFSWELKLWHGHGLDQCNKGPGLLYCSMASWKTVNKPIMHNLRCQRINWTRNLWILRLCLSRVSWKTIIYNIQLYISMYRWKFFRTRYLGIVSFRDSLR